MRLGVALPNWMPYGLDRRLLLDWARTADDAGFELLASVDRPNYDHWDPLTTLAAVAAVTTRARLATTVLVLPPRNEVLVAKQAAVIDVVSEGRLELGVALGTRPDDYEVFGSDTAHRVTRLRRQIERIRAHWTEARASDVDHGVSGPAPVQNLPPILLGGVVEAARRRAIELGDGLVFGGAARVVDLGPSVLALRAEASRRDTSAFTFTGFMYLAIGEDRELAEAVHHLTRYYPVTPRPAEELVVHGSIHAITSAVAAYADAGLDRLILAPAVPEITQVAALAEHVLPLYR